MYFRRVKVALAPCRSGTCTVKTIEFCVFEAKFWCKRAEYCASESPECEFRSEVSEQYLYNSFVTVHTIAYGNHHIEVVHHHFVGTFVRGCSNFSNCIGQMFEAAWRVCKSQLARAESPKAHSPGQRPGYQGEYN